MKKIPLRMCVVSRQMLPKDQLIRIIKSTSGELQWDFTGKQNGRGAYVTNSLEVIQKCKKSKCLNKAFNQFVSNETYDRLLEEYLDTKQPK